MHVSRNQTGYEVSRTVRFNFYSKTLLKKKYMLRPARRWVHDINLIINEYDKESVGWIHMAKNEGKQLVFIKRGIKYVFDANKNT
jgi:uncharacterized protein with PhoU and TrkA domain